MLLLLVLLQESLLSRLLLCLRLMLLRELSLHGWRETVLLLRLTTLLRLLSGLLSLSGRLLLPKLEHLLLRIHTLLRGVQTREDLLPYISQPVHGLGSALSQATQGRQTSV